MTPVLNYHRCHGVHCEGGHPAKTFTSEPEERKRGWARCKCPIVASGSLDRVAKRMATKQTDWAAAAAMMAPYIAANSWDLTPPPPTPPSGVPKETPTRPTAGASDVPVKTAADAYIKAHEDARSAQLTIIGHRLRMRKMLEFCEHKGIVTLDQWTVELVQEFQDESRVASSTAAFYLSILKAFFAFCRGNRWIKENPAKVSLPAIHNRATRSQRASKQKFPFTDDELERMYAVCRDFGKPGPNQIWLGDDMADFIAISVHTGLRISDVAMFHIDRLKGADEVHVRTGKGGTMVYTAVPPWLAERVRRRAERIGPFIFGEHATTRMDVITKAWRDRLIALWERCGPWKIHPTPHRFRHTFARILLQTTSPATVAELLGNTETVVRDHYAAWVPERQERVSKILREAFADVPNPMAPRKPKVLQIKRG
jgi:integrase